MQTTPLPGVLYPANVSDGTSDFKPAKVFKTGEKSWVVYALVGKKPEKVAEIDNAEIVNVKPNNWLLKSGDKELSLSRAGGCGCGNPLKRFRPAGPQRA